MKEGGGWNPPTSYKVNFGLDIHELIQWPLSIELINWMFFLHKWTLRTLFTLFDIKHFICDKKHSTGVPEGPKKTFFFKFNDI